MKGNVLAAVLAATAMLALAAGAAAPEKKSAEKAKPEPAAGNAQEPKQQPDGAGEPAKEARQQTPASRPATVAAKRERVRDVVSVSGVFEARTMHEISVELKVWSSLSVLEAVPHGSRVERGQRLVKLDTEKIDQAIADLELDVAAGELSLRQAEADFEALKKTAPLDFELVRREKEYAEQDLARFLATDRPFSEKSAQFSVTSAEHSLEYAKEELRQLEKMYEADDLTEETEEIVLRRARHAVERAEFYLESDKLYRDRTLEYTLPRQEESMKERVRRAMLALEKARVVTPASVEKAELELEKARRQLERSRERLSRLRRDRRAMEITAPADGVVYYGRCTHGRWSSVSSLASKLRRGGSLNANDVFMTVVELRPLRVRATIDEKDLGRLRPGLKGFVQPAGFPDVKLPARIASIDLAPYSEGKFLAEIALEGNEPPERLVPGMTCQGKFVAYENPKALVIPAASVFYDDVAETKPYVYLAVEKGKPQKRPIRGRKVGDRFEVKAGLKEGDKILKSKPEDDT